MKELVIAADFGSSLGRAIYNFQPSYVKPEWLLLEPEVVKVPQVSIENCFGLDLEFVNLLSRIYSLFYTSHNHQDLYTEKHTN